MAASAGRAGLAPVRSLRRLAGREPLTVVLALAGALLVVLPVWIGRYVPLLDYPNHLSMVFVWFHLPEPRWNFAPYYTTNLVPVPYWAHYGTVYLLTFLVGTEVAQKLFLSAALLAYPLAVAIYARSSGRDPRLGLLAFPLAWNYSTANGFLSYVAGVPVLLLALAALEHHAERPSLRAAGWATLAGTSLYFFHVLPWALFLVIGGLTALLSPRPWTPARALVAPLPTLPAAALGLWAYRSSRGGDYGLNPWTAQGAAGFEGAYNEMITNLAGIPGWLINVHPGKNDEIALVLLTLCWLLLLATRGGPVDAAEVRRDEGGPRGYRVEVGLAVCVLAFLWLPRSLMKPFYWYAVNGRLVVVAALFALLMVRGPLVGVRRLWLAAGTLVGLWHCADLSVHFHHFNQRARGFDEVMAEVPAGKAVLPIMLKLSDPAISVNAYNQWGSYVQMRQGGYLQFNFPGEFPVKYKLRLPSPPWDHNEQFSFPLHGGPWDYFVVRGGRRGADAGSAAAVTGSISAATIDPFAGYHDRVRLVKRVGDWTLWQKVN